MDSPWAKYTLLKERWRYLGFGTSRFFVINSYFFLRHASGAQWEDLTLFLTSIIFTTVLVVFIMRTLEPARYRTGASVISIVLFSAGACTTLLTGENFLGAFLLGTSGGILLNCWGNELADLNERDMVFTALFGWGLASALSAVSIAATVNPLLSAVVFGLFSAASLLIGDYDLSSDDADQGMEVLGLHSLSYSRKLAVSIFALLLTVSFIHYFSRGTFFATYYATSWMEMAEEALGAIVLVAVFALSRRVGVLSVCRITLPVTVAALVLTEIVPVNTGSVFVLLMGSSLILTRMFLLLTMVKFAHDDPRRRWTLFGIGTAIVYGSQLAAALIAPEVLTAVPMGSYAVLQNGCLLALVIIISVFVLSGTWFQGTADHSVDLERNAGTVRMTAREFGLTPRELEVLGLLIEGLTEQEMAERLVVGRGTVHTHIAHIYRKFEVHGREDLLKLLRARI